MKRRILPLLLALPVVWLVVSIYSIQRSLWVGEEVKESLLSSLRKRYAERVFQAGVGYEGPSVVICVVGPVTAEERIAIRDFLVAEKVKVGSRAEIWLEFQADKDADELRQKI